MNTLEHSVTFTNMHILGCQSSVGTGAHKSPLGLSLDICDGTTDTPSIIYRIQNYDGIILHQSIDYSPDTWQILWKVAKELYHVRNVRTRLSINHDQELKKNIKITNILT